MRCFFASDLHGHVSRYLSLWEAIRAEMPDLVLLGGDLLPHFGLTQDSALPAGRDFIDDFLAGGFSDLKASMGPGYPTVGLILGNDDARSNEPEFDALAEKGLWHNLNQRGVEVDGLTVAGYAFTPPSPFQLKDWEKFDVSRFVDPGCVSPEEGRRSVDVDPNVVRYSTIADDLAELASGLDMRRTIFLFHAPPYRTALDRAALDGRMIDHVPMDVHVGSIAIKRFIETRQPLATLHGHIHESTRLTGTWRETLGGTEAMTGAHDGPELALVRFDTGSPAGATRELIPGP